MAKDREDEILDLIQGLAKRFDINLLAMELLIERIEKIEKLERRTKNE